jgi:hypothetical protein
MRSNKIDGEKENRCAVRQVVDVIILWHLFDAVRIRGAAIR